MTPELQFLMNVSAKSQNVYAKLIWKMFTEIVFHLFSQQYLLLQNNICERISNVQAKIIITGAKGEVR